MRKFVFLLLCIFLACICMGGYCCVAVSRESDSFECAHTSTDLTVVQSRTFTSDYSYNYKLSGNYLPEQSTVYDFVGVAIIDMLDISSISYSKPADFLSKEAQYDLTGGELIPNYHMLC